MNYTKYLGIYIDENLSWKYYIRRVTTKMSKTMSILSKVRYYLPLKTLQMLYMTMAHPYLTYCNITWANTYPTRLNPILKTQKNQATVQVPENTKHLRVKCRSNSRFYSYHYDKLPAFLDNLFKTNKGVHSYNKKRQRVCD